MSLVVDRTVQIRADVPGRWRLDTADLALNGFPVSLALVFNQQVDAERLIGAIRTQLVRYPIFHAVLDGSDREPCLLCAPGSMREAAVPITIAQRHDQFQERTTEKRYEQAFVSELLPQRSGQMPRALLAFKLTNFADAFVIGIVWDHVVSDLHGIYDFLSVIFATYRCADASFEAPLLDRRDIWPEAPSFGRSSDRPLPSQARDGIVEISPLRAQLAIPRYLVQSLCDNIQLCLDFDEGELLSHREGSTTTNDLILASLLKTYDAVRGSPRGPVSLFFPINVRPLLCVSRVAVANLIGNISLSLPREQVADSSTAALARTIRQAVSAYGVEQLWADRRWAEYWRSRASTRSIYHRWLFGSRRLYSSSWVSPILTQSQLGSAKFLCLLRNPTLNRLPLPTFHSTVLPYSDGGRGARIVRIGMTRREVARLRQAIPFIPGLKRAFPVSLAGWS